MAGQEYMQNQKEKDNMLDKQWDTKTLLTNIEATLLGKHFDTQSGKSINDQTIGLINEKGAKQVINEIKGRIQNITASAKLRRDEISLIRSDVWTNLIKKIYVNKTDYNVSKPNFRILLVIVDHNLLTFLSRTEDGNFFSKLSDFFTRKETVSQTMIQSEPQKRGFSF